MTTPDDTGIDIPPEREDAVRRLLGSVGDAPALPAEVSDRLDATLAELAAGRSVDPEGPLAPVVALPSRRRKVFAGLFVAAAAVVVAGIGVPLLHNDSSTTPTASSDTALTRPQTQSFGAAGTSAEPKAARVPRGAFSQLHSQTDHTTRSAGSSGNTTATVATARLNRRHLRSGLLLLRHQVPVSATYSATKVRAPAGFTCAVAHFGHGYLLGVEYAGAPAVVAFRAPVGSTQVAEVLQCGSAQVLRSVTLPAP